MEYDFFFFFLQTEPLNGLNLNRLIEPLKPGKMMTRPHDNI